MSEIVNDWYMQSYTRPLVAEITALRAECENLKDAIDKLRAENERLRTAIVTFCHERRWADETWKREPEIAVLFEIARAALEGK